MNTFWQDVRYGLRALNKSRGFALIAVLTLALGIGANTALFSIVNGVLLNPLPYRNPEQLVALYAKSPQFEQSSISYPNFLDWQKENRTFAAMAAFRDDDLNLTGTAEAERVKANMVSSTFFDLLGVHPVLGRLFTPQEDQLGAAPMALISESLWKRKFDGSPDVIGKRINLSAKSYTIIGVIPDNFHYENNNFYKNGDVYLPIGIWDEPLFRDRRAGMGMDAVGRLKPGVTFEQARADMNAIAAHLTETYPDTNKDSGVALIPLKQNIVGEIRPFLMMLVAGVGFVLLIACANVANLLLARSTGRTREFAIRVGASRGRMVRQILTESLLLGLVGGGFGLVLAAWGTQAAMKALPDALPRANEIHLDSRVLLFTLVASVLTGILFGLIPALKTSGTNVHETLKEGGRGASGTRHRTQGTIVAVEMALALVLLVGAGLMVRSLSKLWGIDPGFDPHNVMHFGLAASEPLGKTPDGIRSAFVQLGQEISSVPGVRAASLTVGSTPMRGDSEIPLWLDNEPKPTATADMKVSLMYVTQPDYLKVMKIPLKRGRFIEPSDNAKAPVAMVIDEEFARRFFGNNDPIGRHVHIDIVNLTPQIVGIVGHVKQWGLDERGAPPIQAQCYLSVAQIPDSLISMLAQSFNVVVRTDPAMAWNVSAAKEAVGRVNSQIVVYGTTTMSDIIDTSLASKRFAMVLLGIFAAFATVLASVGIYGVISYIVSQRTHEIGIRMALGAGRANVLRMLLGEAGKMALIGIGVGLATSLALTRLMNSMLYGVSAYDPLTLCGVAVLLCVVALAACLVPARRATRVDPLVALRYE
jgi:predicted permease